MAKAPRRNPFGEEEEPAKFDDFDVFTKIRVLHQLSVWTFGNADRIRGLMPQEEDHLNWRIEPIGWDKDDRAYFVLDDDRLYRRTDEPVPLPTPTPKVSKSKSKSTKKLRPKGTRTSKRRKLEDESEEESELADAEAGAQEDTVMTNGSDLVPAVEEDGMGFGFTAKTWECIAISLEQYQHFLATIFRSRDANEKQLRKTLEENVMPIIEKRADAQRAKEQRKLREIENMAKLATAKRSSRLAGKAEREKQEREEREAEERKQQDLRMAHEEQEKQRRIEEGHESRRLTREQRVKEREVKRILHEEELAKIDEAAIRATSQDPSSDLSMENSKRMSERQLKTQKEIHRAELDKIADSEDDWYFDCSKCGVHGDNLDDGTHSVACERCNVWQHSKCHGFSPKQAEKEGFHFVCRTCRRKEEDANKPKIPPLKLGKSKSSASPEAHAAHPNSSGRPPTANGSKPGAALPDHIARQLNGPQYYYPATQAPPPPGPSSLAPHHSPHPQQLGPPDYRYPPVSNFAAHPAPPTQQPWRSSPLPPSSPAYGQLSPMANGYGGANHQHHQQHQQMHHHAIASAGGHPTYGASYQGHVPNNSYVNGSTNGFHGSSSPPPVYHQHQQQQQPQHQYYPQPAPYGTQGGPPYRAPPPQQPPRQQTTNASQSPNKPASKPSTSPAPYNFHSQPQAPGQRESPHSLNRRSAPTFPVPSGTYAAQTALSPTKSSPIVNTHSNHRMPPQAVQPSPHLAPSPNHSGSNLTGGAPATAKPYMTPQHQQQPAQSSPAPASASANGVAADGMSGPWAEASKVIPQKSDQIIAPISSQSASEARVLPPVALAPSPSADLTGGSIPVKKMPEHIDQSPLQVGAKSPGLQDIVAQAPRLNGPILQPPPPAASTLPDQSGAQ